MPKAGSSVLSTYLRERIEAGEFRAVIDRRYPLEAIADAYRYVEQRPEDRDRRRERDAGERSAR